MADEANAAIAVHVKGSTGQCRGCRSVLARDVAWPCGVVRLAWLAEKIVAGQIHGD